MTKKNNLYEWVKNLMKKISQHEKREAKMKRKMVLYGIIICLSVLFLASNAFATQYYVSATGNDSNPGTQAAPWRTIQKVTTQLTAGDTAYIQDGTYTGTLTPQCSGQAGAWIRFIGQGDNVNIT